MRRPKRRYNLVIGLVLFVFAIMLVTMALLGTIIVALIRLDVLPRLGRPYFPFLIPVLLLTSTIIGTTLAALFGNRPLRPIHELIAATREIANGNFDVRVHPAGPDEMLELAESFNRMAQELAGIETLRTDFINNFSHEFKTPIVSIRGFAKLLKKETLSPTAREEYIDIIISESERLSTLASNVLALSRLDSQGILSERSTFPLDEQIRRVILLLEPEWRQKSLDLRVDLDPVLFYGNEELLQQAWLNLIQNAIKFTPSTGKVTVRLMDSDDTALIRVTDTGIGMDAHTQQHLFDRFYQGDQSHASEGNGLGLALVKRIVELSAGKVIVKSQLGFGSSFTVELPRQIGGESPVV